MYTFVRQESGCDRVVDCIGVTASCSRKQLQGAQPFAALVRRTDGWSVRCAIASGFHGAKALHKSYAI